jgi:hypothetical protein
MSRSITLIAVAGAALTLVVPLAWGQGQPLGQDDPATAATKQRSVQLGRLYQKDAAVFGVDPATEAVMLRSQELGRVYQTDPNVLRGDEPLPAYGYSAMAVMKATEAQEKKLVSMLDARERAFAEKRKVQLASGSERPTGGQDSRSSDHFLANDNRVGVEPTTRPLSVPAADDGTNIEWAQIGFGIGAGLLLALGLVLAVRVTRSRQLAH